MNDERDTRNVVAYGLSIGAGLGIVGAALLSVNVAFGLLTGAAVGLVIGSICAQLFPRHHD